MITKMNSSKPGYVRICFELPAYIWADHIYLVGDFNGWNRECTPLRQDRDGVWRAELDLPREQRFEFRYLVDNRWLTDSHSDSVTANPYGTQNSVVETSLPVTRLFPMEAEVFVRGKPKRTRLAMMD